MGVIHNQALGPELDQVSHEFGLALTPAASLRQSQGREQIIAEGLLTFIVFWGSHRQGWVASPCFVE